MTPNIILYIAWVYYMRLLVIGIRITDLISIKTPDHSSMDTQYGHKNVSYYDIFLTPFYITMSNFQTDIHNVNYFIGKES